jgi:hypothetical protein
MFSGPESFRGPQFFFGIGGRSARRITASGVAGLAAAGCGNYLHKSPAALLTLFAMRPSSPSLLSSNPNRP